MKEVFLTALRQQTTDTASFRKAAHQLSLLLASQSGRFLPKIAKPVKTPMASTQGEFLVKGPVLVSILRSGLVLLPAFVSLYPEAPIGCIGARREEKTATAHLYFSHLPSLTSADVIFLLDPMVATGQSAALAVKLLKEAGALESNIILVSFLATVQGLGHIKKQYPKIQTEIAHIDEQLDLKSWIVPGLGDFGDRYFAT